MEPTVGVIGAGSWGTTLARIMGQNNPRVLVWAHEAEVIESINAEHENKLYKPGIALPETIEATTDLQQLCEQCKFMLVVVPSHVFRKVMHEAGNHLNGEQVLVHCTKGIERGTYQRMSEVLREETCVRKIGVLAGPNLSNELCIEQPAGTLVASKYAEVVQLAQQHLHNHYFRVYGGTDVVGAEVGGAFKNIIAVAAGLVDGLGLGDNTKALLLTRGLNEMARYGLALGAQVMTFGGMAGIGDLMATCASPLSRNHQVGERLAKGQTLEQIEKEMFMVAEGVKTSKAVHSYLVANKFDLPIVDAVYSMLYEGLGVQDAIGQLMARDVGDEFVELGQVVRSK